MKSFKRLCIIVFIVTLAAVFLSNIIVLNSQSDVGGRPYRVEINRLEKQIVEKGFENIDLSKCKYVTNVEKLADNNKENFYDSEKFDFQIKQIGNSIYRFDYLSEYRDNSSLYVMNGCFAFMILCMLLVMVHIRKNIVSPFDKLRELPFELSKGNMAVPLKESKNHYFGRFIWGMDLLREKLEQQKNDRLEMQKEKQTLILSLSHDIKTPLGVIELYSKAIETNLYKDENKEKEIARDIFSECNKIKDYVSEITKASDSNFLKLYVNMGEEYLSKIINSINDFYKDKLAILHIDFQIEKYSDCVIKCDCERSIEVIQNIIENSIKYGDGKEIKIKFSHEEQCVLITIENSGCTLSENELPHIFESFWRGSNVANNSGSGLGLYICRQLMHQMGGEVFAECKNGFIYVTCVFTMA